MLNRQKVLMEMLQQANRPVAKNELITWAFVLRQESESNGGSSFYDFLPYDCGPYSFGLTREVEMLAAEGYIRESGNAWESGGTAHKIESLPTPISRDVTRLVNRLAKKPLNELTNYVDRSYPAFTVHRKSESAVPRAAAEPKVYTAGYEGLQVDGFLNLLVQNGIERLIDVRRNPIARRFGFHKSTLDRLCGLIGISYEHVPELGIASDQRQSLETFADYSQLFDRYERTTLVAQQLAVERVARLMVEKPSVLVCMEADACFCHRSRLAADVAERTGLPIVHLE